MVAWLVGLISHHSLSSFRPPKFQKNLSLFGAGLWKRDHAFAGF